MAKSIPYVGEPVLDGFPALVKTAKVTFGAASGDPDVDLSATGTYNLITLPANCVVLGVRTNIHEAFTTSVTITIGDSDDLDGYCTDTTLKPDTAVTTGVLTTGGGAQTNGRSYSASQPIQAVVGGTDVLAGFGSLFVTYAMAADD